MKKCIYCSSEILDERVVDVCDSCGVRVWGDKMFNAIKDNMKNAEQKGNLNQGNICADLKGNIKSCDKEKTFRLK